METISQRMMQLGDLCQLAIRLVAIATAVIWSEALLLLGIHSPCHMSGMVIRSGYLLLLVSLGAAAIFAVGCEGRRRVILAAYTLPGSVAIALAMQHRLIDGPDDRAQLLDLLEVLFDAGIIVLLGCVVVEFIPWAIHRFNVAPSR